MKINNITTSRGKDYIIKPANKYGARKIYAVGNIFRGVLMYFASRKEAIKYHENHGGHIYKFDSQKELNRYLYLHAQQRAGNITKLERQTRFEIIPKCGQERPAHYTADFTYYDSTGAYIAEDVKSAITRKKADYILRRKLMFWRYGIKLLET